MDCLLANTSARNRAIGAKAPISSALCHARDDLIHATQSQRPKNGKDAAGGIVEATVGIADAAGAKSMQHGGQRFRPLCNECAFTIGHGYVGHIITHQIMGGRMQGHYLRERGWDALESWRNAYAEGRYEAIFNELVRGLFKLDVVLRQKAPRQDALKNLTATERAIVLAYLAGTPVDALPTIKEGATADARSKIKSKWKKIIRDKLRIDITIPWEQHQKLHHADMDRLVRYPGDYWPDAVTVAECFCEESWSKLRKRIKKLRSDEVVRQSAV